ncbi:MAG TPA: metalloregulator ArsR/SmtB family transcription factor [Limnochordales bacterium]
MMTTAKGDKIEAPAAGAAAGEPAAAAWAADERDEELALVARALAHPVRIRILRRLGREGSYCGDLVELLGLAQSTVSHHLRILREAGLIEGEERGPATCYRVNRERCAAVCELVREMVGRPLGL